MKFFKLTALFALNGFFCHALAVEIPTSKQQNIPKELSVFVGHDDLWAYVYHDLDGDGDTDALLITKSEKIKSPTTKNNLVLSILEKNKNGRLIKTAENDKIFSYLDTPKHLFSSEDFFKFQKNQFNIYQEMHAGTSHNSTYTFRKFEDGQWYLTEMENTQTVNNPNTGMVDVVTDLKKYPKNLKKIYFDQFNPDSLVSE